MAQPGSRSEFKQYCLRQLGAPVLEINVADEQCEDRIDIWIYSGVLANGLHQLGTHCPKRRATNIFRFTIRKPKQCVNHGRADISK